MQKTGAILLLLCILAVSAGCTGTAPAVAGTPAPSPAPFLSPAAPAITATPAPAPALRNLSVFFIPVGQGDSILVITPNQKAILIDAGLADAAPDVIRLLRRENVSALDIALATHAHGDHIGGMPEVLENFPVHEFVWNGHPRKASPYTKLMAEIGKKKIPLTAVKAGDTLSLDPDLSIEVLNPPAPGFDDPNNNSIVLRMTYRNVSFLFTGDAAQASEASMLAGNMTLSADILKVGHHGNVHSTSAAFLAAVHPSLAIIEVGAASEGHHPSDKTLARLAQENVTVYRTDRDGIVEVSTNGTGYAVTALSPTVYTSAGRASA
ncbi:ComEC/Rec2 family competence protein [Methanoregula sp. UBA64]|jgi:competence protein ComEC|uniref:ComEC/Rec2 family competence protein n=1 Tax=Methanoregula sp. UBA64 TaxID=1915554 RepID=UPI0025FA2091|nr:ComEC/Rec2 family competence protein [Methanoregula sp. UBA64]